MIGTARTAPPTGATPKHVGCRATSEQVTQLHSWGLARPLSPQVQRMHCAAVGVHLPVPAFTRPHPLWTVLVSVMDSSFAAQLPSFLLTC
ncbi:hypothetical protein BaRGS_00039921 [Batillaria attramentaria]|uniref:Uncharacterized protein n=1 Tax=Batillaria attramentaria TaxID=370345 RepID=A0ABD0J295_9CAEN